MSKSLSYKQSALSLSLLLLTSPVMASPLGSAEMFNAYSRTTFDYQNVDIEGVIGAGGNITYTGGDTGRYNTGANQQDFTVYGGGDVTIKSHAIKNGGVQAGGNIYIENTGINGNIEGKGTTTIKNSGFNSGPANVTSEGTVTFQNIGLTGDVNTGGDFNASGSNLYGTVNAAGGINVPSYYQYNAAFIPNAGAPGPTVNIIDHNQVSNDLVAASQAYAGMTANGTVLNPWSEQWIFDGDDDLNIFDFNGADLAHLSKTTFEGARDATYVINVSGTDIDFGSLGDNIGGFFHNGTGLDVSNADDISATILFNFYEATTLDIYGSLFGSILAPLADVYYTNGAINGSLYANSISGNGQINNILYKGVGPTNEVPAPAPLALLGLGLIPLLMSKKSKTKA